MAKPRIATASLAGCFGCHMSLLDIDERILTLAELVEFDRSPIDDLKEFSGRCAVGLIEGGINTNVVPDKVTFRLDRRMIPEEKPEAAEAELKALIEKAAAAFEGITVRIRRILLSAPLMPLDGGEDLTARLVARATEIMGEPVKSKGVPLYTDARHYTASGIPTVLYGAGPHSIEQANAHRADERLPLADLHKATQVIALTLYDVLKSK